ncbi:GFA family protein [Dongia sp.]|uniref:GFA family protein n=1 Tax=Dongia sp. TaxID=1977262 RepID=UPI003752CEBE
MLKGRCLCGAVSFEIQGATTAPSLCHCSQCRRIHGAPGASVGAPISAYRISGEESLNWYRLPKSEQGFCKICGSKLFWREAADSQELDATAGSLDNPTGLKLGRHIFTRFQGDHYEIGHDGVPRYAESSVGKAPIGEVPPPGAGPRKTEHSGRCECGAVRYRVQGNMRDVVVCHCGQCQRNHGYAPGYTAARKAELTVEGEDNIAWYRSSEQARRGFCRTCGSSLFWVGEGRDTLSITAGSLNAPTGLKTVLHIMTADKHDYYEIVDGVPQVPGRSGPDPIAF